MWLGLKFWGRRSCFVFTSKFLRNTQIADNRVCCSRRRKVLITEKLVQERKDNGHWRKERELIGCLSFAKAFRTINEQQFQLEASGRYIKRTFFNPRQIFALEMKNFADRSESVAAAVRCTLSKTIFDRSNFTKNY